MAGADDLRLLSAHVYSKLKGSSIDEGEAEALAAATMNKATELGSLQEAIQISSPAPDLYEIMQGNLKGREQREFNRVIQKSSMFLKGATDITGGATEVYPKRTKLGNGLVKTHSTKNFTFARPKAPSGMSGMQQTAL